MEKVVGRDVAKEEEKGIVDSMSESYITREEYNKDSNRLDNKIDKLADLVHQSALRVEGTVSRVEGAVGSFSEMVKKMYDSVHGKDGIVQTCHKERSEIKSKINGLFTSDKIQIGVLSAIFIAIAIKAISWAMEITQHLG